MSNERERERKNPLWVYAPSVCVSRVDLYPQVYLSLAYLWYVQKALVFGSCWFLYAFNLFCGRCKGTYKDT